MMTPATRVRRLVLDIGPLQGTYLLFLIALCLFMDYDWVGYSYVSPALVPGLLLSFMGGSAAIKVPLWRVLPVSARDIDRARWWQGVGGPGLLLTAMLAVVVLVLSAKGGRQVSWRDLGLELGGQFAVCVVMALAWMMLPLLHRKWGRWSSLVVFLPLTLIYFRIVTPHFGLLRPSLEIAIPLAILAAAALYLTAGRWLLPLTTALWAAPSGARGDAPSRLSGWPVLLLANLPLWAWLWGIMAFICLALKQFMPDFNLGGFGWMLGLISAQFAVTNLAIGMRAFRALPVSGARLTTILVLLLLAVQCVSLALFALVLRVAGDAPPTIAFIAPLLYPLLYFPAILRYGMRMAQFGYALSILVMVPLQLLSRDAAVAPWVVAGLAALAALGVLWTWHEIARGSRAYRVQPLCPARWRGVE
ncbi:MAG TPA: hypothetical protein VJS85_11095 [Rhizomicrobium sp.]|nr:hypothetical protein [Rhizomicrobium sp.]